MDESVVKHLEQQQVGKLKLSLAIRIGATLRPQARFGCRGQNMQQSCAIMAAAEALGIDYAGTAHTHTAWDFLRERGVVTGSYYGSDLAVVLLDRNNHESREQIADWLEAEGL